MPGPEYLRPKLRGAGVTRENRGIEAIFTTIGSALMCRHLVRNPRNADWFNICYVSVALSYAGYDRHCLLDIGTRGPRMRLYKQCDAAHYRPSKSLSGFLEKLRESRVNCA